MGRYSTPRWHRIRIHFCLANCVCFSQRLSRIQRFEGFPHFSRREWIPWLKKIRWFFSIKVCYSWVQTIFLREWMASSPGGGATGVLHDFDRLSGCEKKNATKRKLSILHKWLCLSRFTKITYQTDVSCFIHANNEKAVCNESLFKIFSSRQRKI